MWPLVDASPFMKGLLLPGSGVETVRRDSEILVASLSESIPALPPLPFSCGCCEAVFGFGGAS